MASVLDIETSIPLVVDLDGTLTVTDTLYESFAKLLFRDPLAALASLARLARGPAAVKRYIAERCRPDAATLPYRTELIDLVKSREGARAADPPRDRRRPEHRRSGRGRARPVRLGDRQQRRAQSQGSEQARASARASSPDGFIYAGDGAPIFRCSAPRAA